MTQAGIYTRMSDLGHAVGFSDIESGKLFEVAPYALWGAAKTSGQDTDGQGAAACVIENWDDPQGCTTGATYCGFPLIKKDQGIELVIMIVVPISTPALTT